MSSTTKQVVEVTQFTDPVCTWCWGSEPVLRKLESHYGDQIKMKNVMGGLVKDISSFYDPHHGIGGDASQSNGNIVKHWIEASQHHGMPVKRDGFSLFSNDYPSTYPQNIAYKAAQMESEDLANRFLRRIREATATEARQTSKLDVMVEIASEVGLDIGKFLERMQDGSAKKAFEQDLALTMSSRVQGFPAFLVRYGDKGVMIKSYQKYEAFQSVIKMLTNDAIKPTAPPKTDEEILKFVAKYGRVAPIEIQTSFDLTSKQLSEALSRLEIEKKIKINTAGNGKLIEPQSNGLECDATSGVCKI